MYIVDYSTGVHGETHVFWIKELKEIWIEKVHEIKKESSHLKTLLNSNGETTGVKNLYKKWIKTVTQDFKKMFGEDRIPLDIKWAVNKAEEGIGIPVTSWSTSPGKRLSALFEFESENKKPLMV